MLFANSLGGEIKNMQKVYNEATWERVRDGGLGLTPDPQSITITTTTSPLPVISCFPDPMPHNPSPTNADIIKIICKAKTEINHLKTRIRQLQGCCEIYLKLRESELETRRWKILYTIELDRQQHQQQ